MSEPIPYDEMRRILGLPDVRLEVAAMRTKLAVLRAFDAMQSFSQALMKASEQASRFTEATATPMARQVALTRPITTQVIPGGAAQRAAERRTRESVLPRPSHTPPPWAADPARTRRTKNGGIDMRTPRV